jgi:hypothetical protein
MLSRIHSSQFDIVFDELLFSALFMSRTKKRLGNDYSYIYQDLRDALDSLKELLFPELGGNASYGIRSDEIPQDAKTAYDLKTVLGYHQSWAENPLKPGDFPTVSYDKPLHVGKEPLAKVEVIKDED